MCFSAQASFLAAALLLCIGIMCALKARTLSQGLLSAVPFFFALQQAAEGLLWILIPRSGPPNLIAFLTYTFLVPAFIIYPLWLPLCVRMLETDRTRRVLIAGCEIIGVAWAAGGLYLIVMHAIHPSISGCHIYYAFEQTNVPPGLAVVLYAVATIVPFLIAHSRTLNFFGAALALSCIISYVVWYTYFVSIWCFFVALLSMGVYAIIVLFNKKA
jgi:hypothetical protein